MKSSDLISEFKYGNDLDIERIISQYSNYVYIIVKNMNGNYLKDEDIEEVVSEVFFVIWKNRMRLNDEAKIKPYLAGVTKNLVRNKYRTIEINYDIEEYENELMDSDFSDNIIKDQEQKEILNIIEVLEKEEYEIFTMFYYDYKKVKEIAKILNYSEGKIKVKLHRIRKKLKKIFKERGYGYGK